MNMKMNRLILAIGALVIHSGCTLERIDGEIIQPESTLLQPAGLTRGSHAANGEVDGFGRAGTEISGQAASGTSSDNMELSGLVRLSLSQDALLRFLHRPAAFRLTGK